MATDDADPAVIAVFEQTLVDLAGAGADIIAPVSVNNFAAHLEGDYFCARFRYDMRQYLRSFGADARAMMTRLPPPGAAVGDIIPSG